MTVRTSHGELLMPAQLTARQFQESDGVADWRERGVGVCACFRTGSFGAGASLVAAIARRPTVSTTTPTSTSSSPPSRCAS